jgi:hypothetical protein
MAADGRFQPGPDPRRHTFTDSERLRGYDGALAWLLNLPENEQESAYRWLRAMVWNSERAAHRRAVRSAGGRLKKRRRRSRA